jgi:putative transposase
MRKFKFVEGKIYHIYNRGVENRNIFLNQQDYFRFIHDLFEFNDEEPATNLYYKDPFIKSYETKSHKIESHKRKLIVEILAFVIMPNHFHLLLKQRRENGITDFMHKLGVGYSMYFNRKNKRSGSLFQGTYKAVLVENDPQFIYLPYYIHLNPLDLRMPGWRKGEIKSYKKALKFLEGYRWSSYLDYIGQKNFPSVTQRKFLLEIFEGEKKYKESIEKWLKRIDLEIIKELILE